MSGNLRSFGQITAGAAVSTIIIPAVTVAADDEALLTDFGATVKDAGGSTNTDSRFTLQLSSDGFASDVRSVGAIQIVQGGTVRESLAQNSGVRVVAGESYRVVAIQGVATTITAELFGVTMVNDISSSTSA